MGWRGLIVATASVLVLTGCGGSGIEVQSQLAPAGEWQERYAGFIDEFGMPPAPAAPYTDAEALAALPAAVEDDWGSVLTGYPDAERPRGEFVRWRTPDDDRDPEGEVARCYAAHGVEPQLGDDGAGGVFLSISPLTEEQAVGAFFCRFVAYPERPVPRLTDEQLGYIWDYQAEFLVPCLMAHGGEQTPMISRDDFLAQWPNQEWYPAWPYTEDPVAGEAIAVDCPAEVL